ncbi:Glutathione synthetase [Schistosoma japonicum]|nr:Glutathione synthetase [Schistosoma japonicum]
MIIHFYKIYLTNLIYTEELAQKLKSIITHSERKFYILMKRIQPYTFENYILNSSSMFEESKARKMVTEMGIFGAILARKNHIFLNECSGHLLRSKPLESNEGGIVAGFGCLDSPFLCKILNQYFQLTDLNTMVIPINTFLKK